MEQGDGSMMHHSHYLDKRSAGYLSEALINHFHKNEAAYREIVIVCVGTNRYTWDSLGPMVGSRLKASGKPGPVRIYGTLDQPVHALNLHKTMHHITAKHMEAYVVGVDACLGQFYKIGTLQLVEEPLQPGASQGKPLPPVGHIHFKGIINNHRALNTKVLEHTSLTFVAEMAAVMSDVLVRACREITPLLLPAAAPEASAPDRLSAGS
ncbi:spore protease YyaC [Paenibacillus darwinianus]|nr:spore protease YyaC [Paenibacillus darwinianus]